MKPAALPAAALALAALAGLAGAEQVTPVQKVIQLMDGMLAKGKAEKHDEQVQYAAYKQFCDDTSGQKKRDINEANEKEEVLTADIEKYTATAKKLTKEVAEHDADIAAFKGDIKAATKVRNMEKEDYDKLHQDYSESIDALERAIDVLKKGPKDQPQALLQVSALKKAALIPRAAKQTIEAFLAEDSHDLDALTAPEAAGYESQSGGVIEMLSKLLDQFVAERTAAEKEESSSKHAFNMLVADMNAQVEKNEEDRTSKSARKAKKLQKKADAKRDLKDTQDTRAEDETYLADLTATCEQKARDFEARQQLRSEEIAAIEKAIEIVASGAVSGNADKHLPGFVQRSRGTALAQVQTDMQSRTRARVSAYLRGQAKQLNSRVLTALATRISEDPFAKVKKMIKDLLVRLMEEANDEAEHKGWCDEELATNEHTRQEKTAAVESLTAEVDELGASIVKLGEDLTELSAQVAALDQGMAEATKLRQEEKEKNAETISDAQEAQTAVAQALTVLKEFYEKAGGATALLQAGQAPPEIFDKPYQGMQGEGGGVVGMLEVIQSDFSRLEADTKSAESIAQKEYDTFMTDSKVDKESKVTDIEHKTTKKDDNSQALVMKKEDLAGTQKELDAALAYFDKLKPSCVDAGVSYEDRVARREAEIKSLQDALKILNGEDLA